MLLNYFTTAWRNLVKNKVYSALNILGLAAGMGVALLIGLWVHHEYSYDRFLPSYESLFQVRRNYDSNGDTLNFTTTSLKLADVLRNEVPEIEYVAESEYFRPHGLKVGEKKLYMNGAVIGNDFFKMFEFPLIQGNANTVFSDPYSIVLTESTARALFGNENPMGKTVRFDNENDLKVSGIAKDVPSNSSLQFNFLVPFSYYDATSSRIKEARAGSFGWNSFQIFVKLKPGVTLAQVASKIKLIEHTEKDNTNAMNSFVVLQPLKNWHLYGNYVNGKETEGFMEYVRMFSIIGLLVLLIACINFINLSTARSSTRAREVGVRKAVGSQRKDLILQFLVESFLLTLLAFLFSLVFVSLALPSFNALTGKAIHIPFNSALFWLLMSGGVIITALLAGSRPAFYLSSFNPVKVLKGTFQAGRGAWLSRKILVVAQFSCSIALIISTIIIYQQIQHAKNGPTRYSLNRLMATDINDDLGRNYTALKNELLQKGIVESITTASSPATDVWWHSDLDNWSQKQAGETVEMGVIVVSDDYFKTIGMALKEGRDFTRGNDTTSAIFNEAAIKRLRLKDPVGQLITFDDKQLHIVGVAKDALMISPFTPADPTIFISQPRSQGIMMYRLSPNIKTSEAITQLTAIFNKYNPSFPYIYQFADQEYAAKFNLELLIGKLAGIFASLAIFISCLGLFGLAAFTAQQRTKEIGIRKVLGASAAQLWLLLSKDFILLVVLSCAIASPIALYLLQNWLQKYDYRIRIGPSVFVLATAIGILITLITVSYQAIKAALANPVKSLRNE
ncbi:FtsX-like permease family protein [Rhodocytophaga rosea]|uniref:FtsX-like permease family protein n=1 Tax=Rhodocytophaga rosea TaxID=2704465 RepID=A0A6C0GME7_9BACT|nr:ABC transporter permease [Rhodocytophaga rosea]QHT69216.1 FtsX-like permease family protein [Rhodocytophaga rosea]